MKKIISGTLALIMVLGTVAPVQATEVTNSVGSVKEDITNGTKTGQDTTQGKQSEYQQAGTEGNSTNVYLTKMSTYTVTIPKTVILDGETDSGTYAVKVEGNLAGKEVISVVPDTTFAMSQDGKEDISATVEQDKTEWKFDEVEATATGTVQAIGATAGSWNGSFNFNISKEVVNGEEEPVILTFTLNDGQTYQFEEGMNWIEWTTSEYNTSYDESYGGYLHGVILVGDTYIMEWNAGGRLLLNGEQVLGNDLIIATKYTESWD